jgi:hypothetical protein
MPSPPPLFTLHPAGTVFTFHNATFNVFTLSPYTAAAAPRHVPTVTVAVYLQKRVGEVQCE